MFNLINCYQHICSKSNILQTTPLNAVLSLLWYQVSNCSCGNDNILMSMRPLYVCLIISSPVYNSVLELWKYAHHKRLIDVSTSIAFGIQSIHWAKTKQKYFCFWLSLLLSIENGCCARLFYFAIILSGLITHTVNELLTENELVFLLLMSSTVFSSVQLMCFKNIFMGCFPFYVHSIPCWKRN